MSFPPIIVDAANEAIDRVFITVKIRRPPKQHWFMFMGEWFTVTQKSPTLFQVEHGSLKKKVDRAEIRRKHPGTFHAGI
jgi:hypothetical protein